MRYALFSKPLTSLKRQKIETLLWWAVPPVVIPLLRWFNDPPESRLKLFVRDFTTYSIGAGVFFLFKALSSRFSRSLIQNGQSRALFSSMIGLTANLIYAGIGAVYISNLVSKPLANWGWQSSSAKGLTFSPAPHAVTTPPVYTSYSRPESPFHVFRYL